jgi:hypothetical protein
LRGLALQVGEVSRLVKIGHIAMRQQGNGIAFGTRTLWVAAAVLAATWNLGILVALSLQEERDQTTRANQEMDSGASELRKSMLRDQAARIELDLAAMRRNVEPQTATATRTVDEASPTKQPANAGLAELQESLQLERDRAGKLEQELATARRDVEAQTALAEKAGAEASQIKKTADAGTADLQKSLQQERDRASKLEQNLAAARRDVETQTALAVKAGEEAAQLKQVAKRGSAEQRQSLQQEHDKAEALAQELSTARSTIYAYEAQARQASDQAAELKQATERGTADLQKSLKSLEQERDRAEALAQELSATRRNVETQTALATKATAEANRLKQVADSDSAELKRLLQKEHDRAEALAQDVSMVHTAIYAYEAQARMASDQAADASAAELRKSLVWEREARLQQDLAAARRDVEAQTALAEKAGAEASQLKKTADAATADLQKSLEQELDRASKLEQDLAAARRDVETQTALAVKAGEEAAQLKQVAEKDSAEQRQSLQQEHDKAEALAQELSAARSTIYAYEAQARMASDQAADGSAAELRESLVWEREVRLQQDVETKTALATRANAEAARLKQDAESGLAELNQSLQRERDKVAQLERDLALARSKESVVAHSIATTDRINTQSEVAAAKPIAAEQAAVADAPADPQSTPEGAAEVARLLVRASVLLGRGDIGSARIVLQRAAEMGDAQASFTLAETYDPLILSKWGTYGTLGDANRAFDLYARAFAGGINEAKERSDALRR